MKLKYTEKMEQNNDEQGKRKYKNIHFMHKYTGNSS